MLFVTKSQIDLCIYRRSLKAMRRHSDAARELALLGSNVTILDFLSKSRKLLHKELFAARAKEVLLQAKQSERRQIAYALRSGSTKRLVQSYEYIPLPLAVNDLDDPGKLVCNPEGVKSITRDYFTRLYDHSRVPELPKPWLNTPSVAEVRRRVVADRFEWPRRASLADFRAMLRRGNNSPSPGPDKWEKWTIKSLSDDALCLILDLHNYEVSNSCFPGDIKDMWLTMFHKRGLRTNLLNWRGLLLSNFLANSPMTWLNTCLMRYSAEKNILPDTQVAAQPGVQTRDLMSFLAGVKCWAIRHKEPVYALKRDQMKGFDYLSPDGFYDAIRSYGLPEDIIRLDRAAQTETRCFIRTAYGITDPITVSGVNKQGGPASPLKSTFTTSLGHYYLIDLLRHDPDALVISTSSAERGDPHLTDAPNNLLVAMVEATDDSYIFSRSLDSLRRNTLEMEKFQYAYGWLTQWAKSRAYVIAPTVDHPDTATFHSVSTQRGVHPFIVTEYEVALIKNDLDFLKTKVDNPTSRFEELRDFIECFQFPMITGRLPITLLRKIVAQNIISRCWAMLYLQPIKQADALELDKLIIQKVHVALGFPFRPATGIALLPVSSHGFGFPSISRINASIAIDGIARDLNHHIPAYRNMAIITLMDWMCEKNGCRYPLDGIGSRKDFTRFFRSIPAGWIVAQKLMIDLSLFLRQTDQSYITQGDVSLTHVLYASDLSTLQIPSKVNGVTLRSLRLKGIQNLKDIGNWVIDRNGDIVISVNAPSFDKTWSLAARNNWMKLATALNQALHMDDLVNGDVDLAIPKRLRLLKAEATIRSLANVCNFPPSMFSEGDTWATDGSMVPAAAGILDNKSVTAAATGTKALVMKIPGRNISILHGEQLGLIIALILSRDTIDQGVKRLLTDHLNSVRFIEDSQTTVSQIPRLRYLNGRSYYRWILSLLSRVEALVVYTPGHSTDSSIESKMNNEADILASSYQRRYVELPVAPLPTFFMNAFTYFSRTDGWIESNIGHYVDLLLVTQSSAAFQLGHQQRMLTSCHDIIPPPDYPYLKAVSAHSAAVQLYARSGQLATADTLMKRGKLANDLCRLGCPEIESVRHIFVHCPKYESWRAEARKDVVDRTALKLETMAVGGVSSEVILKAAKSLFVDDPSIWLLQYTMFYLGQIPDLLQLIPLKNGMNAVETKRLRHHIASDWHTSSIRLAGRIFGDFQRRMAVLNDHHPHAGHVDSISS